MSNRRGRIDAKSSAIGFGARGLAKAHRHLAAGDFEEARQQAEKTASGGTVLGHLRGRISALFLEMRALAALEHWDDLLEHSNSALAAAEESDFKPQIWKMLLVRASARQAKGDNAGASSDRDQASTVFDEIAGSISDSAMRASFRQTFAELEETL